jgi:hypothetical protein
MKPERLCDKCGKEYGEPEIGVCLNCFLGRSSEDLMQEIYDEVLLIRIFYDIKNSLNWAGADK